MKKLLFLLLFAGLSQLGYSQEHVFTAAGGYAFTNMPDYDVKLTGWRINGLYEYNPMEGPVSYGFSFGYISVTGTEEITSYLTADYHLETVPLFFAPKYSFGSEKVKGFVKGAVGFQKSWFERKTEVLISNYEAWGFYGGGALGLNFNITPKVFLDAEYELVWLPNSSYSVVMMNSAMAGIGFRF